MVLFCWKFGVVGVAIALLGACNLNDSEKSVGADGDEGKRGASCHTTKLNDDETLVMCDDGTRTVIENGLDGNDGVNGSNFLSGNGIPEEILGNDGDTYLDISTFNIYKKIMGMWCMIRRLQYSSSEATRSSAICASSFSQNAVLSSSSSPISSSSLLPPSPISSSVMQTWLSSAISSSQQVSYSSSVQVQASLNWCNTSGNCGHFTDARDGQSYRWTKIGTQVWMAQNLNYSGDDGKGGRTYNKGWCFGVGGKDTTQHQDSTTCHNGYGRIYSWAHAMNIDYKNPDPASQAVSPLNYKGLCPTGWHIPLSSEWDNLANAVSSLSGANPMLVGRHLKALIPGNAAWNVIQNNSWDPYAFSLLPAGSRYIDGTWLARDSVVLLWSSGRGEKNWIYGRYAFTDYEEFTPFSMDEVSGFVSLRCLKD